MQCACFQSFDDVQLCEIAQVNVKTAKNNRSRRISESKRISKHYSHLVMYTNQHPQKYSQQERN